MIKKLTESQFSPTYVTNKKIIRKKTKNGGAVQNPYESSVGVGRCREKIYTGKDLSNRRVLSLE